MLSVRNFRGCERADIELDRIALVCGRNHQGKTSLIHALQATALRNPMTITGLLKRDIKLLVRAGHKEATARLTLGDHETTMSWPKATHESTGDHDIATPESVGVSNIMAMRPADRATFIGDLLGSTVSHQDVKEHLGDLEFNEATIGKVWTRIERDGWDVAHDHYQEIAQKLRGGWEEVTGERFGIRKSESWEPENWREDLVDVDLEALDTRILDIEAKIQTAIKSRAVSDAERDRLNELVKTTDAVEKEKKAKELDLTTAKQKLSIVEERKTLLPPANQIGSPCPHCNELVRIDEQKPGVRVLAKVEPITDEERDRRRQAALDIEEELSAARKVVKACQDAVDDVRSRMLIVLDATKKLEELAGVGPDNTDDPDALQVEMARLEADRKMVQDRRAANEYGVKANRTGELVKALSKDGIRRAVLLRSVRDFNEKNLLPCSEAAGWGNVTINEDLNLNYGDRPFMLLSESEQFRVSTTFQFAVADRQGAELVVIDRADVLDTPSRGQLLKMAAKSGRRALIAMTLTAPDKAPDIAKMGIGNTYWIADGRAELAAEAMKRQ